MADDSKTVSNDELNNAETERVDSNTVAMKNKDGNKDYVDINNMERVMTTGENEEMMINPAEIEDYLELFPETNKILGNIDEAMPGMKGFILKRFELYTKGNAISREEAGTILAAFCLSSIIQISEEKNGIVLELDGQLNRLESLKQSTEIGANLTISEILYLETEMKKGTGDAIRDFDKDKMFTEVFKDFKETKSKELLEKEIVDKRTNERIMASGAKGLEHEALYRTKEKQEFVIENKDAYSTDEIYDTYANYDKQNNEHRHLEDYSNLIPKEQLSATVKGINNIVELRSLYLTAKFLQTNEKGEWYVSLDDGRYVDVNYNANERFVGNSILEEGLYAVITSSQMSQQVLFELEEKRKAENPKEYKPYFVKSDKFGYMLREGMSEKEMREAFVQIQNAVEENIYMKQKGITGTILDNNIREYLDGKYEGKTEDGLFSNTTKWALSSSSSLSQKEKIAFIKIKYAKELQQLKDQHIKVPDTMDELFEQEDNDPVKVYMFFFNNRKENRENPRTLDTIKEFIEDEANKVGKIMSRVYFLDNGDRLSEMIQEKGAGLTEKKITDKESDKCKKFSHKLERWLDAGDSLKNEHKRSFLKTLDKLSEGVVLKDEEDFKRIQLGLVAYKEAYEGASASEEIKDLVEKNNEFFTEEQITNRGEYITEYHDFAKKTTLYSHLINAMSLPQNIGKDEMAVAYQLESIAFVLKALKEPTFKELFKNSKGMINQDEIDSIEQHLFKVLEENYNENGNLIIDSPDSKRKKDLAINEEEFQRILKSKLEPLKGNDMVSMDDIYKMGISNTTEVVLDLYAGMGNAYWRLGEASNDLLRDNKRDHLNRLIKGAYYGVSGNERHDENTMKNRVSFLTVNNSGVKNIRTIKEHKYEKIDETMLKKLGTKIGQGMFAGKDSKEISSEQLESYRLGKEAFDLVDGIDKTHQDNVQDNNGRE